MADLIKNDSQMLYLQAKNQFDEAKKKFEDGSIKTETKLIQSVFQAFQAFFVSIGRPMMKPRYMVDGGPPWSEDFNSMMEEIKKDLELLYQEAEIVGKAIFTDFNHNTLQAQILNHEYDVVADKLKDLELLATNMNAGGRIVFHRNDFVNKDKIDYDRIVGTPMDIENGSATLKQTSAKNVAESASITIITGNKDYSSFILGSESNGFPGNNGEVSVLPGNGDYSYQFVGGKNNHSNYGAVLDGNASSWFEYELVNIREHDKQSVAKNIGFDYQVHGNQRITWARDPEDGILRINMQIILKEAAQINNINIRMYTPPNYGAKTAVIKSILISDGSGAPASVMPKGTEPDQYNFYFTPRLAKVVTLVFDQPEKYFTDIGHIYYEQKRQIDDAQGYVLDTVTKKDKGGSLPRVEGPLISLQDIGLEVRASDTNVEAYYPLRESSEGSVVLESVVQSLTRNTGSENIDSGIERFEGWRWCIGIRDIEIMSCEYEEQGEIVTEPYYFDAPLQKITLNVDEDIPLPFYQDKPEDKYKWIQYFVSIDDGAIWHPITPMERQIYNDGSVPAAPKIYTIQQVERPSQSINEKPGYIESQYPVYSMRVRILFQRPTEA